MLRVAILLLCLAGSSVFGQQKPASALPVKAVPAKLARAVLETGAIGSLRADEAVVIRPEIAGRIDRIAFDEGQSVKKGALLATLDAAETRALQNAGIPVQRVFKVHEGRPHVLDMIVNREVRLIVNTPSGRLEFYSRTLAEWGWPEYALPTYIRSHVHPATLAPGEMPLIPTFRLPVQIHTRSANAKWLDEIAHTNPLWIHPSDAAGLDVRTGDLVRVETHIGYFVVRAWVTEGIRPGVLACSHHMGRWKLGEEGQRQLMTTAALRCQVHTCARRHVRAR